MNTNSKQSTDKTHSKAVCRIIGVLFALFAFIWLPTPEVDARLLLISPPDGDFLADPVTVFQWTQSENPAVDSYRLEISEDSTFTIEEDIKSFPKPGDSPIIAPQVAVDLRSDFDGGVFNFWRVIGLNLIGDPIETGEQVFSFTFELDQRGFTVISGLVKSDLNQLGLVGARVAVLGSHAQTAENVAITEINGYYIVIALTSDGNGKEVKFPIEIISTKEGFKPTKVNLLKTEKKNGAITRDLEMEIKGDSEGDNLRALPHIPLLLLSD